IEPEGLATPDDPAHAVAIELDPLASDLDGVVAALLDGDRAAGERFQGTRAVLPLLVADEHHLDRDESEATREEETVGHGTLRGWLPVAPGRGPPVDTHLAVDPSEARGHALDLEALGHLAAAEAECGHQRLLHPTIGVLVAGLEHQTLAVAPDLVGLLPGGPL